MLFRRDFAATLASAPVLGCLLVFCFLYDTVGNRSVVLVVRYTIDDGRLVLLMWYGLVSKILRHVLELVANVVDVDCACPPEHGYRRQGVSNILVLRVYLRVSLTVVYTTQYTWEVGLCCIPRMKKIATDARTTLPSFDSCRHCAPRTPSRDCINMFYSRAEVNDAFANFIVEPVRFVCHATFQGCSKEGQCQGSKA